MAPDGRMEKSFTFKEKPSTIRIYANQTGDSQLVSVNGKNYIDVFPTRVDGYYGISIWKRGKSVFLINNKIKNKIIFFLKIFEYTDRH